MKKIKLMCDITLLFFIIVIVVLYYGYNKRISDVISKVSVPVASYDIEKDIIINLDMLTYKQVSIEELEEIEYFMYKENIVGKITTKEIEAGEFFNSDNLSDIDYSNYN